MKKLVAVLGAILSLVYILNPSAGFIELIPDNLPFLGNLDEAGATAILIACLRLIFTKKERELKSAHPKDE